ncbi:MerR family transcriptional regulator [Pseudomonas sp. BN411]|uniref:MerR family transcriptional regulator n=1 Tax=Pseudomonas sp. BN411 TaxID=2567887 RepID=UPI00245884C9|nr:MerR family transcriptional regulator [Pseudomonas sp. BN411]MDH4559554.1 MerR family transcriptional regulator [Pseudomonas sp. BN411]
MAEVFSIGKLAERAGVGVETVRYYQRRGLLEEPRKGMGGQRRYAPDQLKRLCFIKRAQALGFTLAEVSSLLAIADGQHCMDARMLAVEKLHVIEMKLAALTAMHQALCALVQRCEVNPSEQACPLIETLIED